VFKCNVKFRIIYFFQKNIDFFLVIPDDIMDVERVVDEDKDSDPNKVNRNIKSNND